MSDDPLSICPQCGKELRRLINGGSGVIFKGSGFYVTDRKGEGGKAGSASKSADSGAKPADTAAKPADSGAKSSESAAKPACAGCAKAESGSCRTAPAAG
jgi:hypothetical protein